MMKIAFFLFSAIVAAPAFAQATFDFKGVALRSSEAELLAAHPGFRCGNDPKDGSRRCTLFPDSACVSGVIGSAECAAAQSYGGARYKIISAQFIDGVGLAGMHILMPSSSFRQVVGALTEKLGRPDETRTDTVKTRAGVEYPNVRATWKSGRDVLTATQLSGDITSSSISITTPEAVAAFEAARRQAAKTAAGNL